MTRCSIARRLRRRSGGWATGWPVVVWCGALTPAGAPMPLHSPVGIAFGPTGRHLYVAEFTDNTVTTFAVGHSGDLTAVQTQPSGGIKPAFQAVTLLDR
jgi:DNA-binding beta-propeller fold protein YncE